MANLASHGDTNACNAAIGEEFGAVEVLVKFLYSPSNGVRWKIHKLISKHMFFYRLLCGYFSFLFPQLSLRSNAYFFD